MIFDTGIMKKAVDEWETDPSIRLRFPNARVYVDYLHCGLHGMSKYKVVRPFHRNIPGELQRTYDPGDFLTLSVTEAQARVERGEVEIPVKKTVRS